MSLLDAGCSSGTFEGREWRLVVVCLGGATELVPGVIGDKIAERDASLVVQVNKPSTEIDADDPYASFKPRMI